MKNKVLLVTTTHSVHSSRLEQELASLGAEHVRLNTDNPKLTSLPQCKIQTNSLEAHITSDDGKNHELSEFQSVWWGEVVPNSEIYGGMKYGKWAFLETQKASDWILSSLEATYINNPIEIIRASNKVKQLKQAKKLCFSIPETLISSQYETVRTFIEKETIYKPISRPTPDSVGDDFVIYTNVVNKNMVIPNSIECKLSLFQRYVPKKYEIRTYVIGNECLSAEIHSQKSERSKIDWRRYDIANTPHYPHALPDELRKKCVDLTKSFGLSYSAIDMILTPDSDYVFLELNPQGMWLWAEELTGLPITNKLAKLLAFQQTS